MLHSANPPGAAFCFCSVKFPNPHVSFFSTTEKAFSLFNAAQILNGIVLECLFVINLYVRRVHNSAISNKKKRKAKAYALNHQNDFVI